MTKIKLAGRKLRIEFTAATVLVCPALFDGADFFHITRPRDTHTTIEALQAVSEILLLGLQAHHLGEFRTVADAAALVDGLDAAARINTALQIELRNFLQPRRKGFRLWRTT
jgi:hypothetical protein